MTEMQYYYARKAVVRAVQDILDAKDTSLAITPENDEEQHPLDEDDKMEDNENYCAAEKEFRSFEHFKKMQYMPKLSFSRSLKKVNENGLVIELGEGQVTTHGKDWPQPSGRNMADYVTSNGRFDSLTFFNDHKKIFPNL